jgi:hypothetical protein
MKEYTTKEYTITWQSDLDCDENIYSKSFFKKQEAQEFLEEIRKETDGLMKLTFTTTTKKVITIVER